MRVLGFEDVRPLGTAKRHRKKLGVQLKTGI